MPTPTLPGTLSYSQIDLFLRCPQQWARKHVYGQPIPATFAMLVGQVVHDVLAAALRAAFEGAQRNDPAATARSIAVNTRDRPLADDAQDPDDLRRAVEHITASAAFHALATGLIPAADANGPLIERAVDFTVPGCNRPVLGYIDLITDDAIIDFKVTSTRWSEEKAEGSTQGLFYTYPFLPTPLPFQHVVLTVAKRGVELQQFTHGYTLPQYRWLETLIRTVNAQMESRRWPPNPTGWTCARKQCLFYTDCRDLGHTYPEAT
jgi:hypothetical protein